MTPFLIGNSFTNPLATSSSFFVVTTEAAAASRMMTGAGPGTGLKHENSCPSTRCDGGSVWRQVSVAKEQRGAKRQPTISFERSGGIPAMEDNSCLPVFSMLGMEASSAWV